MQLFGLAQTLDTGSDLQITAAGQVLIDGLVTSMGISTSTAVPMRQATASLLLPVELDPVTKERLSGGEIRNGLNGLLTLLATDGILQSQADRVLLNGVTGVEITGQVTAASDLTIHAGIDQTWSLEKLENGPFTRGELTSGDVLIAGAGSVRSGGAIRVVAGGNLDVQSDATLGGGLTTLTRPIVTTVPQTVWPVVVASQRGNGEARNAIQPGTPGYQGSRWSALEKNRSNRRQWGGSKLIGTPYPCRECP